MSARKKPPPYHQLDHDLAANPDLRCTDKVVYAIIANLSNMNGNGKSWPGLRELGKKAGIKAETVQVCIDRLVLAGLLRVRLGQPAKLGQRGISNRYTPVEKSKWPAAAPPKSERPPKGDASAPPRGTPAPPVGGQRKKNKASLKKRAASPPPVSTKPSKSKKQKQPPDPRVKTVLDRFCELYREATGEPYIVDHGKDGAILKRLLKELDDAGVKDAAGDLERAAKNMLGDAWGHDKASIGVLKSNINAWRGNGHPRGDGPHNPQDALARTIAQAQKGSTP